jgi:hypothetical protein
MDITINKNKHNGALVLSAVHNGYLVTRQFYFYSTRAAKAEFINYLRSM